MISSHDVIGLGTLAGKISCHGTQRVCGVLVLNFLEEKQVLTSRMVNIPSGTHSLKFPIL